MPAPPHRLQLSSDTWLRRWGRATPLWPSLPAAYERALSRSGSGTCEDDPESGGRYCLPVAKYKGLQQRSEGLAGAVQSRLDGSPSGSNLPREFISWGMGK